MATPASPSPPASGPPTVPAAASPTLPGGQKLSTILGEAFARTQAEVAELRSAGAQASRRLAAFIDASPTPYHVVRSATAALQSSGFEPLREQDAWTLHAGARRFVVRDGSTLVAFIVGERPPAGRGFRVLGAHTDSPTLRVKPHGERSVQGYQLVGVEPYGGAIWASWLDRDLSLAGRVLCRRDVPFGAEGSEPVESVLVDLARPVARVANVAAHLNRKANDEGLKVNVQRHLPPIVGLGDELRLREVLGQAIGRDPDRVVGYDLCFYDVQKAALGGLGDEFLFASRLDNLASVFAAIDALASLDATPGASAVVALHDHEECGSRSAVGAAGPMLRDVLERIVACHPEPEPQAWPRAMACSWLVSADMAHAVHPHHAELHDSEHAPALNRGLVVKSNANQSYATSGLSAAYFTELCHRVGYEPQHFVSRSDLRCGTTIGPIVSGELGIRAVDVGAPMLSMHSCREMAGTLDVHLAIRTYQELFRS